MGPAVANAGGEAIGIDVGGTKINAFRVARDGEILDRAQTRTPAQDEEATLASMIDLAQGIRTPDVLALGVGAAGLVDSVDGVLRFAPNLAWRDLPIADRMRDALGLPCQVDNDANVAAFGEYRFGSGRGYRHMLLVTVGTGIGGGIITGRAAVPRRPRLRGGDRPHHRGAGGPALRLRQPWVLGAGRGRSGDRPHGARGGDRARVLDPPTARRR